MQRRIPDGVHEFWDYLDDDFNSPVPVRIKCQMSIEDGHIHMDYTGTDPQVASAFNVPTGGTRHPWLTLKLMHLVGSLDTTIPLNFGLFENISVSVPKGTILNPVAPSAVGVRAATAVRVNDVIVGVLTRALPGLMPCPSGGTVVPVVVAERDAASGAQRLSVIQTLVGGTRRAARNGRHRRARQRARQPLTTPRSSAARPRSAWWSSILACAPTAAALASGAAAWA